MSSMCHILLWPNKHNPCCSTVPWEDEGQETNPAIVHDQERCQTASSVKSPQGHPSNWWRAWAAGPGLGVRLEQPALGSLGFHQVASSVSPKTSLERKVPSASTLQPKSARMDKELQFKYLYVQQRSCTWISISRDHQTAAFSETVLQNAIESAGIYSNFPKALFRPNKEFIFKESLCKRIQVTQSIENILLLITTTLTRHKQFCNNCCCLYTHWTLYQHREENTWRKNTQKTLTELGGLFWSMSLQ